MRPIKEVVEEIEGFCTVWPTMAQNGDEIHSIHTEQGSFTLRASEILQIVDISRNALAPFFRKEN